MRLRKVKHAQAFLDSHPESVIKHPENLKGKWKQAFANDYPIHLEIGSGKGRFIIEMAKANPTINFIAIEKFDSVIIRILEKLVVTPLENVLLIHFDAFNIDTIFSQGEIETIYLNFSDPWPKSKKAKYRLTYPTFLEKYKIILNNNSKICFKTDNFVFYEYSLMNFNKDESFRIDKRSLDLDKEQISNVETEFEIKFKRLGLPIYYIEVVNLRREL